MLRLQAEASEVSIMLAALCHTAHLTMVPAACLLLCQQQDLQAEALITVCYSVFLL